MEESEICATVLEYAVEETDSDGGYFHFVQPQREEIELAFWSKGVLRVCEAAPDSHYPLHDAGIWADSARLGRPVVHNDYVGLPDRVKGGLPEGHFDVRRHMCVAVIDGGEPVAILGLGNKETPYEDADVRVAQLFADGLWTVLKARRSRYFEQASRVDTLTGLLRRTAFERRLSDEWSRARRSGGSLVLLMADIDHFKRYNDAEGHLAGDRVLAQVGEIIRDRFERAADATGRFGGEEFVVLVPGATCGDAPQLAERLRSAIEEAQIPHPDSPVSDWVTLSVGVSHVESPLGSDTQGLLRESDVALYEAKHLGRNQVVLRCGMPCDAA